MTAFNREAHELALHRKAKAGDKSAQRELENMDLRRSVNARVDELIDGARKGDATATDALKRFAAGASAAPARAAAPAAASAAQIAAARAAGVNAERARWTQVFAHAGSHGHERACADVLGNPAGHSAASIIAGLDDHAAKRTAGDEVWDRVHGKAKAEQPAPESKGSTDDVWAKAYAKGAA